MELKRENNFGDSWGNAKNIKPNFEHDEDIVEAGGITQRGNMINETFLSLEYKLCYDIEQNIKFSEPVSCIYNPIEYAKEVHCDFIRKFCGSQKDVLLLGMNPGPWGMCQTGVPFGQVSYVKNWLQLVGNVNKPYIEHPNKPVKGFECTRKEVSGTRFWGLLKELSEDNPQLLFKNIFLHNYCPFAFLSKTGKNITPPEIKIKERKPLEDLCDSSLKEVISLFQLKYVVCIGNYVSQKTRKLIKRSNIQGVQVVTLMHPSPINPAANKGWTDIAKKQLSEAGILHYFKITEINVAE